MEVVRREGSKTYFETESLGSGIVKKRSGVLNDGQVSDMGVWVDREGMGSGTLED